MAVRHEEVIETQAVTSHATSVVGASDAAGSIWIPLNRLKKSANNVRTVPHTEEHIKELAAMINEDGQLYPLIVEAEIAESGEPTGDYLVTAGEGRRLAQLERAKHGRIAADEAIWCKPGAAGRALELSLSDNKQEPMHPADEFDAFKKLIEKGRSIEYIAAYRGIKPVDVQRRLKLANVAPEFIEMFRQGTLEIDHMMAFALTDDHEQQRAVWESLPKRHGPPSSEWLRSALIADELPLNSALAKFVGVSAYEKTGGPIRRDLFSKNDQGYIMDVPLLTRLATEKLEKTVGKLKKEGCAWAEARLTLDYSELQEFGRVAMVMRDYTEGETARLAALAAERDQLESDAKALSEGDEQLAVVNERLQTLREEAQTLAGAREQPNPDQQRISGAIATIDNNGKLRVERGLLMPADKKRITKQKKEAERAANGKSRSADRTHSAALLLELTAHRTLALQAVLADRPDLALVALTHRLIMETFSGFSRAESAVQISADETNFERFAQDIKDAKAYKVLAERKAALKSQLPRKPEALFAWLLKQPQSEVLALLAFCVAVTLNGVRNNEDGGPTDPLDKAARLDMREWWKPTAANYFGRIRKEHLIGIVSKALSPSDGASLRLLKKRGAAAEVAEERMAKTDWLPSVLRSAES
jgi:ParB family chromosome partitioning protein